MTYLYDQETFVTIPTDYDYFIKLRDSSGKTVKTISDEYCSVTISGNVILIKQKSDLKQSNYSFDTNENARLALQQLELAISKLKENKNNKISSTYTEDISCSTGNGQPNVLLSNVWTQSNNIDVPAPLVSNNFVQIYEKVIMNNVPGTYTFIHNNFINVIPLYVDPSYKVLVYTYDDILIPDNYKGLTIDYDCNQIRFKFGFSDVGHIKFDANRPIKASFYRYLGTKGDLNISYTKYSFKPSINNQTEFIIGFNINQIIMLSINGQVIDNFNNTDYVVVANTLTWLNNSYSLSDDDIITILYK